MASFNASADELRAIFELTQRVPMTRAEALFIEALFTRWLDQIAPASATPGGASAADVLDAAMNLPPNQPPADRHISQASQPLPAGKPSTNHTDQVQSTQKN